jgi:hypothetical protein
VNKFDRKDLRRLGVRTATDLENAIDKLADAPLLNSSQQSSAIEKDVAATAHAQQKAGGRRFHRTNKEEARPAEKLTVADLMAILETLKKEPNLYHVRQWKKFTERLKKTDQSQEKIDQSRNGGSEGQPSRSASNGRETEDHQASRDKQPEIAKSS